MVLLAFGLLGYGYGPEQDPFVQGFKQLAADARSGRWSSAESALRALGSSIAEVDAAFGTDLDRRLRDAIRERDGRLLARQLTLLAYLSIEIKFESSRGEELADYYAAKYRLEAARGYYMELLAPAVRRRPSGADLHARIWSGFDAARAALGSPGFLGRGATAPDLAGFDAATGRVGAGLRQAFPFIPEEIR